MPKELEFTLDPQLVPIHLQFNYLLRDEIPQQRDTTEKTPETDLKHLEDEVLPPSVLARGYFDSALDQPSHVVLNHINCM